MIRNPRELAAAREAWLDGLRRRDLARPTPESALELARGQWRCGHYPQALAGFRRAAAMAPEWLDAVLGLLDATAMLARFDEHASVLAEALASHAGALGVQFHAARSQLGEDPAGARARLLPFVAEPLIAQYVEALAAVAGAGPYSPRPTGDDRLDARADALRWVASFAGDAPVHVGHPAAVLSRALAAAPGHGLTLECGVYFGRSLRIIADASPGGASVHGFDSFEGLPEAWSSEEGPGAYSTGGRLPDMPPHVRLHPGWFEDTLPVFFAGQGAPIRLLHVDCDLYASTATVLEAAAPHLAAGSVVVFDDLLAYPGFERHELRAFEELRARHGIRFELLAACLLGREVAFRVLEAPLHRGRPGD